MRKPYMWLLFLILASNLLAEQYQSYSFKTTTNTNPLYELTEIEVFDNETKLGRATIKFYSRRHKCEIDKIMVDSTARGKGIGSLLFNRCVELLKKKGCTKVVWKAHPFEFSEGPDKEIALKKLVAFYEKLGGSVLESPENSQYTKHMEIEVN